jgi:hypothetical protein
MPHQADEQPSRAERDEDPQELGVVIPLDRARARREEAIRASQAPKRCRHDRHVGTCPECQRAQLARWSSQLAAAVGE